MSWNQEREEKLKELWKKGHTASQIAEMLGGTTRNAVIGKVHRLKLAARAASKGSKNVKKQTLSANEDKGEKFISRKARFKSLLLDKNFEPENPKALEQLEDKNCRWPIGHPNEKTFIFAEEPLWRVFPIVNCMFYTLSSLKIKKRNSLIKRMMFRLL